MNSRYVNAHHRDVPTTRRSARLANLLGIVTERGEVTLAELATILGTSAATIRRDVTNLADQGLVLRIHGGVKSLGQDSEIPVRLRDAYHRQAKQAIGRVAAGLLPTGKHAIALTGGTTTLEVLRALHSRDDLTIVTNSLSIGVVAAEQGQSRVLITGGVLRPNSQELVGPLAEKTLAHINVGTAFVGCEGICPDAGLTTHDDVEALTNRVLISQSQRIIVVADGSKVGRAMLTQLAQVAAVDTLVTDDSADPAILRQLRARGLEVVTVPVS